MSRNRFSSTERAQRTLLTLPQALHPGGPFGARHRRLAGRLVMVEEAQRGDRGACVLDLMGAGEIGKG